MTQTVVTKDLTKKFLSETSQVNFSSQRVLSHIHSKPFMLAISALVACYLQVALYRWLSYSPTAENKKLGCLCQVEQQPKAWSLAGDRDGGATVINSSQHGPVCH